MRHQEFEPPEQLRDTVKCFWHNQRDFGSRPSDFKVQPDGYAEIIFYFGSLGFISGNGDRQPLPSPFMIGLLDHPLVFCTKNRLDIIGIRCFPWTVFDLLELKSAKGGVRLFEHPIAELQPQLTKCMKAGKLDEALLLVEQFFLKAKTNSAIDSTLFKAGAAMKKAKGTMPVSQVAEAAHATVRTLERKFKHSSGHTVKDVSGLMRFEQVRNRLWHHPDSNLAALADELGYTDQSHLSREFKRYSSATPAAFARKARKGKKAFGNDFVAFVQA